VELEAILHQIDSRDMALPEFQRGYVWNRDQVRGLMSSLYRRFPVGSLLVWVTATDSAIIRAGADKPETTSVRMLLDGQQRITSLYGIMRGTPPPFFEGAANAFTNLYFHLGTEVFEFYAPMKMANDPLWVDVSRLMREGIASFTVGLLARSDLEMKPEVFIRRLNQVAEIGKIDLHIEEVVGADKTLDVVVDIFNRVNSGGTKLSKGDLALAKLCAEWPEARQRLRSLLATWQAAGYDFRLEWLLRNVTTVRTGQAMFSGLEQVTPQEFEQGLGAASQAVGYLLNLISARLGLDHDRVLGGRYAFPVMARYLVERGGKLIGAEEQGKLLYWYVHSFLWGRYAGATETTLNQDLVALERGGLDGLIDALRHSRADLVIRPEDFAGTTRGARFYPLLYLLTRTSHARDLGAGGLELSAHMLGKLARLQVHHIFPQARLYKCGYARGEVNAIANFCFLTQDANLEILDRAPEEYFAEVEERWPRALESQWIPTDPELRTLDRYRDFLAARRELLAAAANTVLDRLVASPAPPAAEVAAELPVGPTTRAEVEDADTQARVEELVAQYGLATPTVVAVVEDPLSGAELGMADFLWSEGLQGGYDEPVAIAIDPQPGEAEAISGAGYHVFQHVDALAKFLARRSEELAGTPTTD
jgi:hypothetical protein